MNKPHKDWVKMTSHQCQVCMEVHEHNTELVLDKKFREIKSNREDGKIVTYIGLCEKHDKLYKQGYLALVVITNAKGEKVCLENAERTGELAHIRRDVFNEVFSEEIPKDTPMIFVTSELYKDLIDIQPNESKH